MNENMQPLNEWVYNVTKELEKLNTITGRVSETVDKIDDRCDIFAKTIAVMERDVSSISDTIKTIVVDTTASYKTVTDISFSLSNIMTRLEQAEVTISSLDSRTSDVLRTMNEVEHQVESKVSEKLKEIWEKKLKTWTLVFGGAGTIIIILGFVLQYILRR